MENKRSFAVARPLCYSCGMTKETKTGPVSVGFISLGCSKNLVDSQILAGYLKAGKIALAASPETADVILINTCAFIDAAREEAAEAILSACEQKKRGGCKAVIVAGCMVARYRERLVKAFPGVDAFLGIDELERVADVVERVAAKGFRGLVAAKAAPHKLYEPLFPTLLFTGGPFAYVKVADGCDHRCAYCAIPLIRGRFRSRQPAGVLKEMRSMLDAGVKELNLVAQDILRYGCDLAADAKSKLPALLRELDKADTPFWWRLLYGYPSEVSDELLELLAESPHACRYLDLPIQHSHPDILRAMNRPAAVDATLGLAQRLRKAVPGITLRTTCLVGFPGETEEHFEHLLAYAKEAEFDHLGVFAYSPEEGTAASGMDGVPPPEVAEERCERLMAVQKQIVRRKAAALAGSQGTALLLRKKGQAWIARLPSQAPEVDGETRVTGVPATAKAGDFIPVTVTGGRGYDLAAEAR